MENSTAPLTSILEDHEFIQRIAREYETPAYVYSADRITDNIQRFTGALETHLPKYQLLYAVKANMNPAVLKVMQNASPTLGVDCSSPGEIETALKVGFSADRLVYTGNYESRDDLTYALEAGVKINFDDISSYRRCKSIELPKMVSFRVNPGSGKGAHDEIVTAGKDAKFGMSLEKVEDAYREAIRDGVTRFGMHTMVGSGILEDEYFPWNYRRMLKLATEIEQVLDIRFEYIDLGGGFGIPQREWEEPLDLDKIFAEVQLVYREFYPDEGPALYFEPGRYLIGDASFLLSSVTGVKDGQMFFVGLDAGMNTLIRPMLYGAYHRIVPLLDGESREARATEITGRICESTDRMARERELPELRDGDLVAILDTGAYGFVMASRYNGFGLPAEVLVDRHGTHLIRIRETMDDLTRNAVIPEYLTSEN